MSDGNWLATLGSWLVLPAKAILRPWWKELVEEKAETLAVRQKLLEAIVRFRINDCKKTLRLDSDRAGGIALKVIDRLKASVNDPSVDLGSESFLKLVEAEIELHTVQASAWVQLACLAILKLFNPNQALVVQFTNDDGGQSHASSVIASLQGNFPFTNVMSFSSDSNASPPAIGIIMIGQLSTEATAILKEYCSRSVLPESQFEVHDYVAMMGWPFQFASPQILPRSWKPE